MSGDAQTSLPPPPVLWAQRSKVILLTICLEDCKKPEIKIQNDRIYFKGMGGTDKKEYEVTINLYDELDPEKSIYCIRDRIIEFILQKKNSGGSFWPHLTKEKVKYHWLKVDFNKWEDEDASEESDYDFDDLVKSVGLPQDSNREFDDVSDHSDSDDDLPNLV